MCQAPLTLTERSLASFFKYLIKLDQMTNEALLDISENDAKQLKSVKCKHNGFQILKGKLTELLLLFSC